MRKTARGIVLLAAIAIGCRGKSGTSGTPSSSSASVSPSLQASAPIEARGWFVVEGGGGEGPSQTGAGWWLSSDAVRTVWPGGRDRRAITSSTKNGDVLHLVVEDAVYDVTRTATGLLLKIEGDEHVLKLRVATDDELRAMEKLDAQLMAKSGDACARAATCCAAAQKSKLATAEDCTAITSTPELSRCVRLIERLRKSAATANQTLAECGAGSP